MTKLTGNPPVEELTDMPLTGDIRGNLGTVERERLFVRRLAELMEEFQVSKVDVCWTQFKPLFTVVDDR